jgi:hypothetical protein
MWRSRKSCVIGRDDNVVVVDFTRKPAPPAPLFPGASGLRQSRKDESESQFWIAPIKAAAS